MRTLKGEKLELELKRLEAMRAYGLPKYPKDVVFPDWKLLEEEEEIESWR